MDSKRQRHAEQVQTAPARCLPSNYRFAIIAIHLWDRYNPIAAIQVQIHWEPVWPPAGPRTDETKQDPRRTGGNERLFWNRQADPESN